MSSRKPLPIDPGDPVYRADKAALGCGIPFEDLNEAVDYVTKILSSAWWKRRYPRCAWVELQSVRSQNYAYAIGRTICLPPDALHECYVLHELAHVVAPEEEEGHHGPIWRGIYVDLIQHQLGKAQANCLRYWLDKMGVPAP